MTKIIQNRPILTKIDQNVEKIDQKACNNCKKSTKIDKILTKILKNWPKLLKIDYKKVKLYEIDQDCQKLLKIAWK